MANPSDAQRKYFPTKDKSNDVPESDKATKGLKLPERKSKESPLHKALGMKGK